LTAIVAPLAWLVVRDRPEETGGSAANELAESESGIADIGFADALRSPAFWVFALASSLFGLVYSGIALFNQSILELRGFDAGIYHTALVISTLVGLCANFGGGWLASSGQFKLTGISMSVWLLHCDAHSSTFMHVVAYAIAFGIVEESTVVFFSVWAQDSVGQISAEFKVAHRYDGARVRNRPIAPGGPSNGWLVCSDVVLRQRCNSSIASWYVRLLPDACGVLDRMRRF
jgi:hypothetical protein